MKLVDWDKVKISYDKQVSGTITEPIYNIKVEAPTVEAIPIEWAVKYDANLCHSPYCFEDDDRSDIERMVDDWRKENGFNR